MMCVFIMPFYGKYKVIYRFEQTIEHVIDKIEINGKEQKFDRPTFLNATAVVTVANNDTLICKILKGATSDEES